MVVAVWQFYGFGKAMSAVGRLIEVDVEAVDAIAVFGIGHDPGVIKGALAKLSFIVY